MAAETGIPMRFLSEETPQMLATLEQVVVARNNQKE